MGIRKVGWKGFQWSLFVSFKINKVGPGDVVSYLPVEILMNVVKVNIIGAIQIREHAFDGGLKSTSVFRGEHPVKHQDDSFCL